MVKAKIVQKEVRLKEWELEAFNSIEETFGKALKQVFAGAVEEAMALGLKEEVEASLSSEDPNEMLIWLPWDSAEGMLNGPSYKLSLSAIIEEEIEFLDGDGNLDSLKKMSSILVDLLNKTHQAISSCKERKE